MESNDDGIIKNVNLENYRAVALETLSIALENENSILKPTSVSTGVSIPVPEPDSLTHILNEFHKLFGDFQWAQQPATDTQIKNIFEQAREDSRVKNAIENSDEQNVRNEINRAVGEAVTLTFENNGELYMAYYGDTKNKFGQKFKTWLNNIIFQSSYSTPIISKQIWFRKAIYYVGIIIR